MKLFENKVWEEDKIIINRNSLLLFLRDQEKKQKSQRDGVCVKTVIPNLFRNLTCKL